MKTKVKVPANITSSFPVNWESSSEAERAITKSALAEACGALGCECNGTTKAVDSVATTINQRIRALAIERRVDVGVREIASSKGVDVATAPQSEIVTALKPDEINSLIIIESVISQETIESVVTNDEMAGIQTEELVKNRKVRDPHWERDINQLVDGSVPHMTQSRNSDTGLFEVHTSAIQLETLLFDVDENGEICAWIYEEIETNG